MGREVYRKWAQRVSVRESVLEAEETSDQKWRAR